MTTVRCPRCHDEVTMPPRAGKQTHVRCPLCLEDYLLDEALRQSPPMLEVIGGELEPAYAAAPAPAYAGMNDFDAGLSPAGQATGEAELAFAPEITGRPSVFNTAGPAAGEAAVAPAGGVRASTRPKRKPKSALGTIVGVVLGGGLGVALAPIAIWWIAGTDPFELAPKVPAALQFVLPEKLKNQGSSSVATNSNPPMVRNDPGNSGRATSGNAGENLPGNNNDLASEPMVPAAMPDDPLATPVDPLATPADPLATPVDPLATPADPLATPDDPLVSKPNRPEPSEANPEPAVKPVTNTTDDAPVDDRKATDLLATLIGARAAAERFTNAGDADKEERRRLATEAYEAACQLGPMAVALDLGNGRLASAKEELQAFIASQAGTPGQISAIGFLAGKRLDDADAPPGILVAGKVLGIQPAGSAFAVTLAVGRAMREVTVISQNNPEGALAPDDVAAVAGVVVRDPERLKEFEVAADSAVMAGVVQKVE